MDVFSLVGKLELEGADRVGEELDKTHINAERVRSTMKVMGAALTAAGAAGIKLTGDARKLNAQFGQVAIGMGLTTSEVRNLALETTNVTFPLQSVASTFDILTRAGIRDAETLKDVATSLDTLGDAVGRPAEMIAGPMITAMKTFGLEVESAGDYNDQLTYLLKNTTLSMENFGSVIGYTTPEVVAMGLTLDDTIALLGIMEERGETGEVATRAWRRALSEARDEGISMSEALGITSTELEVYRARTEAAEGITQKYADAANTQYGVMDRLKQSWSEMSLRAGSFLEPMEPILAGMTALGPIMMILSSGVVANSVAWVANTAAIIASRVAMIASTIATHAWTAAQWLFNAAISANPIGLLVLAIAGLITAGILLWKNWDTIKAKAVDIFTSVKDFFIDVWRRITGIFSEHWDMILAILFPAVGLPILIARHWEPIAGKVSEIFDRVVGILRGFWQSAVEAGRRLVEGLWEGIESTAVWLWRKISGFATGIFNAIKEGLGPLWPGSPSEAGIAIGSGLAEGIGEGIEKSLGSLDKSLGKTEKSITQTIDYLEIAIGRFVASSMDAGESSISWALAMAQVRKEMGDLARQIIGGTEVLGIMAEEGYTVEQMLNRLRLMLPQVRDPLVEVVDTGFDLMRALGPDIRREIVATQLALHKFTTDASSGFGRLREVVENTRDTLTEFKFDLIQAMGPDIRKEFIRTQLQFHEFTTDAEAGLDHLNDALRAAYGLTTSLTGAAGGRVPSAETYTEAQREAAEAAGAGPGGFAIIQALVQAGMDWNEATEEVNRRIREAIRKAAPMQHGGLITEPTLLFGLRSMRPYATAGEAGAEVVRPVSNAPVMGDIIFHISGADDPERIARVVMEKLEGLGVSALNEEQVRSW